VAPRRLRVFAQAAKFFRAFAAVETPASFLLRMALNALEHRNIAQVYWMLKGLVGFMAKLAFVAGQRAQINRVLEWSGLYRGGRIQ
jgi:hypothetical protein